MKMISPEFTQLSTSVHNSTQLILLCSGTRWALGCCSNNQIRIFQTARSRLYRGRFLQPNTHFLSIFRDLQDRHTFAPLQIQNLQIFCEILQNFANFLRFLQNVAEIVQNR